jgi:hypothetical protein
MKIDLVDAGGWLIEKALVAFLKFGWLLFLAWGISFLKQGSNQCVGLFTGGGIWLALVLWPEWQKYRRRQKSGE